jgi:cytochrome c
VNTRLRRRMINTLRCAAVTVILTAGTGSVHAQSSPSVQRGMTFARANCSHCHATDKVSPSPLAIAPPFRTLHERYPVETLKGPLSEGIVTGHANMPEFKLAPDQVADLIEFLKSLQE